MTTLVGWLQANPGAPVGLTLDSSVAMPDLPVTYRRVLRRLGATPGLEAQLETAWRSEGAPFDRLGRLLAALEGVEVPAAVREELVTPFIRFGHGDLQDWTHVLPWVGHAHAKFWDWEDADAHVRAPHRELVTLLVRHGYRGSISSEFGGIAWLDRDEVDIFELTREHIGFLRSALADTNAVTRSGRAPP